MKHIIKVNNIQDAKDNHTRPLIALDSNGVLFAEGKAPVPEGFVDLGLPSGTLWSTKNIGATNGNTAESWYGNYYAWGELEPKEQYNQSNYKYANGANNELTKYCSNSNYGDNGFTDELRQLVPEDDVATVTKSAWRMPTNEDFDELLAGTTSSWVTDYNGISGLNGRLFIKAKITRQAFKTDPLYWINSDGVTEITDELWLEISMYTLEEINALIGSDIREQIYKDNEKKELATPDKDYGFTEKEVDQTVSMFIPAAGYRSGSDFYDVGSYCGLWSSSLDLDRPNCAYDLSFDSDRVGVDDDNRCIGLSVRPIC